MKEKLDNLIDKDIEIILRTGNTEFTVNGTLYREYYENFYC